MAFLNQGNYTTDVSIQALRSHKAGYNNAKVRLPLCLVLILASVVAVP
jgi:hypothetical protein